jgi:hypothetical protein
MFKSIQITGEEFSLQIDRNADMDLAVLRINDFILDEEKTKPGETFYQANRVLEVYPTIDEVKEIIKALQQILPEEDGK